MCFWTRACGPRGSPRQGGREPWGGRGFCRRGASYLSLCPSSSALSFLCPLEEWCIHSDRAIATLCRSCFSHERQSVCPSDGGPRPHRRRVQQPSPPAASDNAATVRLWEEATSLGKMSTGGCSGGGVDVWLYAHVYPYVHAACNELNNMGQHQCAAPLAGQSSRKPPMPVASETRFQAFPEQTSPNPKARKKIAKHARLTHLSLRRKGEGAQFFHLLGVGCPGSGMT